MKRKATYNPEHRTHVVTFRLNDREWDIFQAKLESAGITQSEYLRQIALTAKINVTIHPVYINKNKQNKISVHSNKKSI